MIPSNERSGRWRMRIAVCVGALTACSVALRLPDVAAAEGGIAADATKQFVRVSPRDARYFELTDGRPYVPVGFNLVGAPQPDEFERVVEKMARHGVNYCRIWLDQKPWSIEQGRSGEYDAEAARHLDRFLALCRARGIRVKMCVEFFRNIPAAPRDPKTAGKGVWSDKPLHHVKQGGYYENMPDFLNSERGRAQFKKKLAWYAERYKDEPAIFAWELWNEMNAVQGPWEAWTREMLPELHRLFPKNLAVQSLGSFDRDGGRQPYRTLCTIDSNDVQQVHRYLDLGAQLAVCHGPIDVLAADAVAELRGFGVKKPIILTETGAVKPRHTGASELYAKDKAGVLLHDMLFAPFFSGAAGPGHVWFWREAIDGPDHWRHFARFNRAIEGLDPPAEDFRPATLEHPRLRVYALVGKRTALLWCRDKANDWQSELIDGRAPAALTGLTLDAAGIKIPFTFDKATIRICDPWQDRWSTAQRTGATITLPEFQRSVVVRIRAEAPGAGAPAARAGEKGGPGARPSPARPATVFAPSSFWYTPIPAQAPLHPNSANFVAEFLRQKKAYYGTVSINATAYASPVYIAAADAPTVRVTEWNCQKKAHTDPELAKQWSAVPIPDYAEAADGTDAEMTIYQPATDTMWEFWRARKVDGQWEACWGGRMQNASKGPGIWQRPYGTCATGLPFLGGQITADELQQGKIEHALGISLVDIETWKIVSWPANRSDGYNPKNAPNRIPEGLRFRLDPTVDVDALKMHPVGKAVAKAAQKYGFVVWDKAGAITLRAENPKSYTRLGKPDPYPAIFKGTPAYALLNGFPWDKLQFLPMDYGKPAAGNGGLR